MIGVLLHSKLLCLQVDNFDSAFISFPGNTNEYLKAYPSFRIVVKTNQMHKIAVISTSVLVSYISELVLDLSQSHFRPSLREGKGDYDFQETVRMSGIPRSGPAATAKSTFT